MGARRVMPLRVLLPCLAVCLVAPGAAAVGAAVVSAADGYVTRQADDAVRACAAGVLGHGLVVVPGSGPVASQARPGACDVQLRNARGQMLVPTAPAAPAPGPGPGSAPGSLAHLGGPVTMPGTGGERWRAVATAVRYQPQRMAFVYGPDDLRYVISGSAGPGSSGLLTVMTPLAGPGPPAARYAAAAGTVLVLLAAAALVLTRAILNASRAAEAAARRSAADMSGHLSQTCLRMRRHASIAHGFTEYYRGLDSPPPAGVDRMLQRVTDEITRMVTLAEGLRMHSASEAARPDRRPGTSRGEHGASRRQ